jgi:hypothetical protein
MSDLSGIVTSMDTVITNITRDPYGVFLAALEPGVYPIRDLALGNRLRRPDVDIPNNKIMWNEGATGTTSMLLNTQISSNATTEFDFGTTVIKAVVPNMLIAFLGEIVRVVSVNAAAGTCEVTRGYASTTPEATILVTDLGRVLSITPSEDEDAGSSLTSYGSASTNYLHYYEEVVRITDKSAGQTSQHRTPESDVSYQILDKFKKIGRELAHSAWLSVAISTGTVRLMNGLRAQVTSNISTSVGDLLFADIDDAVQTGIDNGVICDTLFLPPALKKLVAKWSPSRLKTVVNGDPSTAGGTLNYFESAPGPVIEILPDNSLLATDGLLCRKSDLHLGFVDVLPQVNPAPDLPQMTGLRVERMGRKGAYHEVQVLAYATSQLTYQQGQTLLTGITGVDSDGV